ncbi:hypothetical protein EDD21DRAFT_424704 [Dissophora ornata]|nr:hypothetical protein EDD21DRAFT_424704 [Dissophora ornata]
MDRNTHVVGSAIHANGRRWVELSNRATNTLVNVLCANIVPRRRGEEQAGGLVGGAWPLMATAPRQNVSRSQTCMAPSLLGSTAPPAPLGSSTYVNTAFGSASFTEASSSRVTAAQTPSLQTDTLSENLARRISQMMEPLGLNMDGMGCFAASSIRDAIRAELSAMHTPSPTPEPSTDVSDPSSNSASASNSDSNSSSNSGAADPELRLTNNRRTRVEEVEDEEMP